MKEAKEFFPKLKNYEIKSKKERTSEQCPELVKKKSKKAYTTGQDCFNDIIIRKIKRITIKLNNRTPNKPYRH
jgi:GTP cyclohydrolase II